MDLGGLDLSVKVSGEADAFRTLGGVDARAKAVAASFASATTSSDAFAEALKRQTSTAAGIKALNAEINNSGAALRELGRTVVATSAQEVEAFRKLGAEQRAWLQAVGASAVQIERFENSMRAFERRVDMVTRSQQRQRAETTAGATSVSSGVTRSISAINALSFGFVQLAASGTGGFRSIATAVGSVASLLGPEGAIVGGLIGAGLAMTDFFNRSRREIEETARKAKAELDALQNRGDVSGLTERARVLRQGTPAAGFEDSIDVLEARIRSTEARLEAAIRQRNVFAFNALTKSLRELRAKVAPLQQEFADILARVQAPGPGAVRERAAITTTGKSDKQLAEEAKRAREEATRALDAEVRSLAELGATHRATAGDMARAIELQRQFSAVTKDATKSIRERAVAAQHLKEIEKSGLGTPGIRTPIDQSTINLGPIRVNPKTQEELNAAAKALHPDDSALQDVKETIAFGLGDAISAGLAGGVAAGLASGSFKDGLHALAQAVISSIAGLMAEVVAKLIPLMGLWAAVRKWAFAHPLGAIAAGLALIALASALSAATATSVDRGSSGGSFGSAADTSGAIRVALSPRPAVTYTQGYSAQPAGGLRGPLAMPQQPIIQNFTVLGARDPSVQKFIADAAQRGVEMGAGRPTYGRRGIG